VIRRGFLVCCRTFAEGEHRCLAGSTMISPDHPTAQAFPENFRVADSGDRATREAHRLMLLAAQSRLDARSSSGLWGLS
jgi:hypothetical protein